MSPNSIGTQTCQWTLKDKVDMFTEGRRMAIQKSRFIFFKAQHKHNYVEVTMKTCSNICPVGLLTRAHMGEREREKL